MDIQEVFSHMARISTTKREIHHGFANGSETIWVGFEVLLSVDSWPMQSRHFFNDGEFDMSQIALVQSSMQFTGAAYAGVQQFGQRWLAASVVDLFTDRAASLFGPPALLYAPALMMPHPRVSPGLLWVALRVMQPNNAALVAVERVATTAACCLLGFAGAYEARSGRYGSATWIAIQAGLCGWAAAHATPL